MKNVNVDFDERALITSLGRAETAVAGLERQLQAARRELQSFDTTADDAATAFHGFGQDINDSSATLTSKLIPAISNAATEIMNMATNSEKSGDRAGDVFKEVGNQAVGIISTISPVAGSVAGVVNALAQSIGDAMQKAKQEAEKADLEGRFGKIKLSMEEAKKVAENITATKFSMKVDSIFPEVQKISALKDEIQEQIDIIERMNWKVKVGLTLTENEKDQYIASVDQYIQKSIEQVEQNQYSAYLTLSAVFGENSPVLGLANTLYSGLSGDLKAIGKQFSDYVNEAFKDGMLSPDEVGDIELFKQRINQIVMDATNDEYTAKLEMLKIKYGKANLDPESFEKLSGEIDTQLAERKGLNEKTAEMAISMLLKLERNGLIDNCDTLIEDVQKILEMQNWDADIQGINYKFDTVQTAFSEQLNAAAEVWKAPISQEFSSKMREILTIDDSLAQENEMDDFIRDMYNEVSKQIASIELSSDAHDNLNNFYQEMKPQYDQLVAIRDECASAGKAVPEGVLEGISQYNMMGALLGDVDSMWSIVGETAMNSPEFAAAAKNFLDAGNEFPEEIADGIANGSMATCGSAEELVIDLQRRINGQLIAGSAKLEDSANQSMGGISRGMANKIYEDTPKLGQATQNLAMTTMGSFGSGLDENMPGTLEKVDAFYQMLNEKPVEADVPGAAYLNASATMNEWGRGTAEASILPLEQMDSFLLGTGEKLDNSGLGEKGYSMGSGIFSNFGSAIIDNNEPLTEQFLQFLGGLGGLLGFSNLPQLAYALGDMTGSGLGNGVGGKNEYVAGQMSTIMAGMSLVASNAANSSQWSTYGYTPVSNFATGMGIGSTFVSIKSSGIVDIISGALSSFPSEIWGSHLVQGFVNGMSRLIENVRNVARNIADAIRNVLHFTRPDEGPLRDYETWMPHFVQGLAEGMDENRYRVMQAARRLSQSVSDEMGFSSDFDFSDFATPDWQGSIKVQSDKFFDPEAIMEAVSRAMRENPVVVENRIDNYTTLELDGDVLARKTEPAISRLMQKKSQLAK